MATTATDLEKFPKDLGVDSVVAYNVLASLLASEPVEYDTPCSICGNPSVIGCGIVGPYGTMEPSRHYCQEHCPK